MAQRPDSARWVALSDTVFQHWLIEQGLPHSAVTALAQDGTGFLWIGTQDGLARWDGYHFRHFKFDAADTKSLPNNFVRVLFVDPHGQLWVGTRAGLDHLPIALASPHNSSSANTIKHWKQNPDDKLAMPSDKVAQRLKEQTHIQSVLGQGTRVTIRLKSTQTFSAKGAS